MDVLQFALEMEQEGERYYSEQAAAYAGTPLQTVFDLLAKDEAKHADILRGKMDGTAYELKANELLSSRESPVQRNEGLQAAGEGKARSGGAVPCRDGAGAAQY